LDCYGIILEIDNGEYMAKHITESEMAVMRTLKLSGSTWAEIAAIFGYNPGSLKNKARVIMEGTTKGDVIKRSSFGKSVAMHVALTSDTDDTRLRAAKVLSDAPDIEDRRITRSTRTVVEEITRELASK
jgi:hypothetical protein